ncbi:MAG TPA: MC/SLC25 family protein, partial [Rhabdochlamydiaceae bacterium]
IHPKSREVIRATSSIFTSLMMLPVDRMVAKKIVGQVINRETLQEIAKKPFLGIAPRLTNAFLGSFLTFGGSAAFHGPLEQRYPMAPILTSAMALAGGTMLDRVVTAPLGTLGLRMQTQDKTFFTALHETICSERPLRSLYAGTPALLMRDLLYLPVCIPMAEKLRGVSTNNNPSPLTEFFKSTLAFTISGTAASTLSYPLQYIGVEQKNTSTPLTMKQVFAKARKESGLFGVYRGFGMATGRIALYNCLFGGVISLGERLVNRFS